VIHSGLSSCPQSGRWRSTRNIKSMTTRIAHFRAQAYVAQRELCYYCRCKMCISDPAKFARSNGISVRQVRQVQCTAEHLTSRRDGGTDTRSNIAAACWHCNKLRHNHEHPPLTPYLFPVGASSNDADTNAHCHRCVSPQFLHATSANIRISPPGHFAPQRYPRRTNRPVDPTDLTPSVQIPIAQCHC
jgi:hypothetical protein